MSDQKCFTVTWAIENFSIYSLPDFQELKSLPWQMLCTDMSIRNYQLRGYVTVSEVIFFLCNTSLMIYRNCEMSLISPSGTIALKRKINGCFNIDRNDIFGDKNYLNPSRDTLTVCCKISGVCINEPDLRFYSVLHKMNFSWTIDYFLHDGTSHSACRKNDSFQLLIRIVSKESLTNRKIVTATLEPTGEYGFYFIVDLRFLSKQVSGYGIDKANHFPNYSLWRTECDILKAINTDKNLRLEFECIIAVSYPNNKITSSESTRTSTTYITSESAKTTTPSVSVEDSSGTLTNDLLSILRDTTLSDATLNTEGKSFSAHKIILSARSSVFKAMYEKEDTTEGRSGIVNIEDIDSETVQRLLVFLYGESLEELQWDDASKLYYAADKYAVLLLKRKCSNILQAGLSDSNACAAIVLADRHSDDELMTSAIDYVRDHQEVMSSSDWEELEESVPRLAAKILRQVFIKKGKEQAAK